MIKQTPRRRPAFTLIELLVVISIIALLISILLPALRSARDVTRMVVCQSNARQMGVAWTIYSDDYDGSWPLVKYRSTGNNYNDYYSYEKAGLQRGLWPYLFNGSSYPSGGGVKEAGSVFVCPQRAAIDADANSYAGLFYHYRWNVVQQLNDGKKPLWNMQFWSQPSSSPMQWCSQARTSSLYNSYRGPSWHASSNYARPLLFADGHVAALATAEYTSPDPGAEDLIDSRASIHRYSSVGPVPQGPQAGDFALSEN